MNWDVLGTLGTWAAVVVALGIALKDTIERKRESSARHLLTAAAILPEVAQSKQAFESLLSRTEVLLLVDPSEKDVRDACDSFLIATRDLGLQHLDGFANQVGALPENIVVPLVKAMTLARMLAHNGEIARSKCWGETEAELRYEFREWREQVANIVVSLKWVEKGIYRLMRSRRWQKPEQLGW
jgi:hypothetical protein